MMIQTLVQTKDKYVILQELEHLYPEINFTTLIEDSEKCYHI